MLKLKRLDGLSDGIFAIVMTLIVIEIKVPHFLWEPSSQELWHSMADLIPSFISYVLSFTLLFTYWRAHHFFTSVYAKNIDTQLTNINAVFFLLVALVPFSSSLLAEYSYSILAIAIFGGHMILTGLIIYWMRRYVLYSPHIKNPDITKHEIQGSVIRTLVPVVVGAIAIPLAFVDPKWSLSLYTLAVIFNLSPASTRFLMKIFKKISF